MASEYDFPSVIQGNSANGTTFYVTVNGTGINFSGADIEMNVYSDLQAPCATVNYNLANTGLSILSYTGIFSFNPQIINIPANNYVYDITFYLSGNIVQTYITGYFPVLAG